MKKELSLFGLFLVLLLSVSCSTADYMDNIDNLKDATYSSSYENTMEEKHLDTRVLSGQFASRLMESVDADSNVLFSPMLLQMSLTWLADCATDDVRAEVMSLLGRQPVKWAEWQRAVALSSSWLSRMLSEELTLAHAVWLQEGTPLVLPSSSGSYAPHVSFVDFGQKEETWQYVWEWMERIKPVAWDPSYISPFLAACRQSAMLGVAMFKDSFQYPFEELEMDVPFTCADGTERKLAMASGHFDKLAYAENERMQCVELPCKNGYTSLRLFLPKEGYSVSDIIGDANGDVEMKKGKVCLKMPCADMYGYRDWKASLQELGFNELLTNDGAPGGAAEGAGNAPPCPSALGQQVQLIIEQEVETDKGNAAIAAEESAYRSVSLDHPYLFTLVENSTGLVLLEGQFVQP
ncbi:MAG: hypothetical protein J5698_07680 [Bacteroidaceae bacterium]|nr:hypothetical protein [Bacteroidaceae bacterium]